MSKKLEEDLLATANSLDNIRELISEFYCTDKSEIQLLLNDDIWEIFSGDRKIKTTFVWKKGKQYRFCGKHPIMIEG